MKRKAEPEDVVSIDVGGALFKTTRTTLTNSGVHFPGCIVPDLFHEAPHGDMDVESRTYFVDTDPELFRHILQVLRRPTLVTEVPHGVTPATWYAELDFWGLTDQAVKKEERASHSQRKLYDRNLASLERLGEEIQTTIRDNEVAVIRAILDGSGYSGETDKARVKKIRLPKKGYVLASGTDLGLYIDDNSEKVQSQLLRILSASKVAITKDIATKHFVDYQFGGTTYNTKETPTLVIELTYNSL
jgi:hypothetical protein